MSVTIVEPRTLKEIDEALLAKRGKIKGFFEAYPELDMPSEVASQIKQLNDECNDLGSKRATLADLEQIRAEVAKSAGAGVLYPQNDAKQAADRAAQDGGHHRPEFKSLGQLFIESATFKQYDRTAKRGPATVIELAEDVFKATVLGHETKATLTETGFAPQAIRIATIVPGVLRRPVVASLLPEGTTSQIAVVYMEETTTTNGVATVAEGAAKPESALAFTERTAPVRKIAGILKITNEMFDDVPALRSYVEQRLRLFLVLAEEDQLLNGNGTAPNITGLLNTSGILTQAMATDTPMDAIYKAMTKIATTSFLQASGGMISPNNWQTIRLVKTTYGEYIYGPPQNAEPAMLWGVPFVVTTAMADGTALVGAFDAATQIFRRSEVAFDVATQNEDDWKKNIVALRVEERLALAVYRPSGLCTVTGLT